MSLNQDGLSATREHVQEVVPHSVHAFSIIVKRDPLTAADCKAACTDNASDPLTRPLIGSVAPDPQPKHDDGELISMLHRTLLAIHGCKWHRSHGPSHVTGLPILIYPRFTFSGHHGPSSSATYSSCCSYPFWPFPLGRDGVCCTPGVLVVPRRSEEGIITLTATTRLMCATSSSSYRSGSLVGFFFKISTI